MTSLDPNAFAELLAGYCLDVQKGEQVLIRSTTLAEPLVVALQREVYERGGWPFTRIGLRDESRLLYEHAQDWQLDDVPDFAVSEAKAMAKSVTIQAPYDTEELVGIDPALMARVQRARELVREQAMKRRWCVSLWPTQAQADRCGLTLEELEAFVASALFLDRPAGPVTAWGELRAFQEHLIKRLSKARQIRIEAPGTDLTLDVRGRDWINSDGKRNMPSGEVFTGPKEDGVNGRIRFTVPTGPAGVRVSGVELELRDGVVVAARADEGEEYLKHVLATDAGASRFGELGIGTNFGIDRAIGVILFDEKIGGTVHCALGRSYPETGGKNASAVHWDLICDLRQGGRITADGTTIQQDGRFVG